jgi:hypothetical protein
LVFARAFWPVAFASFLCPLAVADYRCATRSGHGDRDHDCDRGSYRVEYAAGLASSAGRELELAL